MGAKLEAFEEAKEKLKEQQRDLGYYASALELLQNGESVHVGGRSVSADIRATFQAAVERELTERRYLVAQLEDDLEQRLK